MDFNEKVILGNTGAKVSRLGVASAYGAPTEAFEEAFERGVNYFYWGSRRTPKMGQAIKNICNRGDRGKLLVVLQVYNRFSGMMAASVEKGLEKAGLDYADILLLGWYNSMPSQKILDAAVDIKNRELVKYVAISGHQRTAFIDFAGNELFDILHLRYNAAHRGAEKDVFPHLPKENRPGVVIYTATRWASLLKDRKMPPGEKTPRASDCYRFVLSNPSVDVCMTGPKNVEQMREALATMDRGPLSEEEMAWMKRVGDHVHGKLPL